MYVNGRVQLWASLIQVYDGFDGQWASTLCPVEGEVPALAAGAPALEPQRAAEEHAEGAVGAHLGERAFLRETKVLWHKPLGLSPFIFYICMFRTLI